MSEINKQIKSTLDNNSISVIDIRLDGLNTIDFDWLKEIIKSDPRDIILTLRSEWKDLDIVPPVEGRKSILQQLIRLQPDFIDLEFPRDVNLIKLVDRNTRIILSLLDFHGMAKISIEPALDLIKNHENIILKIAATPNSVEDLKLLWKWSSMLTKLGIPKIIIGMGELGKISRIKSMELKNLWTYGKLDDLGGEPYIPGMLPISTLNFAFSEDSWHFGHITYSDQSDSNLLLPIIQTIFAAAELNSVIVDFPIGNRVDLSQLMLWVNDGLLDGVLISEKWQYEVIEYLDELDYSAKITGQANFVIPTKNGLKGYNTKVEAINRVLTPYSKKRLSRVYIEGEGNYIKSIIFSVKDFADLIVLRGISEERVKLITSEFPFVVSSEESFTDTFDLVINNQSSEVGFERISPIPPIIMDQAKLVLDLISGFQNDSATITRASKIGIPTAGEREFLINSILVGFELWTKRSVPIQSLSFEEILS